MSRDIDYENLRIDLDDYYVTDMFSGAGMAMDDLEEVDRASEEKLIEIAKREKIDLSKYEK